MAKVEITGVNHFAISVADMEESIAWYRDVFGFKLFDRMDIPGTGIRAANMYGFGLKLEIFEPPADKRHALPEDRRTPNLDLLTNGNKHISFGVPDGKVAKQQLIDAGIEIVMEALVSDTYGIFIRDNTGNLIEIFEEAGPWWERAQKMIRENTEI